MSLLDSRVDVRLFGAKGDGVTDDTAAIQAAIDHAALLARADTYTGRSHARVQVWFPSPDAYYRTTAPLTALTDFMELVAATQGVLIHNVTNGSDVIRLNHGQAAVITAPTVRRLTLKGTGATSRAIYVNQAAHLVIDDVNTLGHPGMSLYMESVGVNLNGCAFGRINILCQPSAAVVSITDKGGLCNRFVGVRVREAEVAFYLEDTDGDVFESPYIESNNRGAAKTGIQARRTVTGYPMSFSVQSGYFENNSEYAIDADGGYFVKIDGAHAQGGDIAGVMCDKFRLDGGGKIEQLVGTSGVQIVSAAKVEIERSVGYWGLAANVIPTGLLDPRPGHYDNQASRSWAEADPATSTGGSNPPARAHDVAVGYLGTKSKKLTWASGIAYASTDRVYLDNMEVTPPAGGLYAAMVVLKADRAGEVMNVRLLAGGSDAQDTEMHTATDWQVCVLAAAPTASVACKPFLHLQSGTLGVALNVWLGGFAADTSLCLAMTDTGSA